MLLRSLRWLWAIAIASILTVAIPVHAEERAETPPRRGVEEAQRQGRFGAEAPVDDAQVVIPFRPTGDERQPSSEPHEFQCDDTGCISVGSATHGRLEGGIEMPLDTPAWHFTPAAEERSTNYGSAPLIHALQRAGTRVRAEYPDARMLLGNISFEGGGDLPWSVSHNSGRDADIAFFVVDRDGEAVEWNHFTWIRRNGTGMASDREVRFDLAQNWLFVEDLLTNPRIQVQWMFVSNSIRRRLLAHATKEGADPALIEQADQILHQPSDSTPHADHFHVRIYCSLHDTLNGCEDAGPFWPWVKTYENERAAHIETLVAQLKSKSADERIAACANLGVLKVRAHAAALTEVALNDKEGAVREKAFASLIKTGARVSVQSLKALAKSESTRLRVRALRMLGKSGGQTTARFLIDLLEDPKRPVRDAVRYALRYTTNTNLGVPSGDGPAHLRLQSAWRHWYKSNADDLWAQWMRQGFEEKGITFGKKMMRHRSIPTLIRTAKRQGHIGYNAQRVLGKLTGHRINPERRHGKAAYKYWRRWWRRNHKRFGHRRATL